MSNVTQILSAIEGGDPTAAAELLPLVYDELRKLAAARLAEEKPGQTLQATALVHEAYLRLVGSEQPGWNGRGHFFAAAAEAMRRILVERRAASGASKLGGGRVGSSWRGRRSLLRTRTVDLVALDEALSSGWPSVDPHEGPARQTPLLRRPDRRSRRPLPSVSPRYCRPPLGVRPGVAPPGTGIRRYGLTASLKHDFRNS